MVAVEHKTVWQIRCFRLLSGRLQRGCRGAFVGWTVLALLLCLGQCGCVQRRLTVRTNPPGALLYVDDYEIGTTPISVNFNYYGTRKIKLVKDGYETLTVMETFPTPWYEIVPLDLVSENLVPGQIKDRRALDFQLKPQAVIPKEQLMARAEETRRGVHTITGVPLNPAAPGASVPGAATPIIGQPILQPVNPQPSPGETITTPEGVGGQTVHPLPNGR